MFERCKDEEFAICARVMTCGVSYSRRPRFLNNFSLLKRSILLLQTCRYCDGITTIRLSLQKLAGTLYGIHKIHGNYGRVFSEWSGIEKEMGDGLQSAGHFMDA